MWPWVAVVVLCYVLVNILGIFRREWYRHADTHWMIHTDTVCNIESKERVNVKMSHK